MEAMLPITATDDEKTVSNNTFLPQFLPPENSEKLWSDSLPNTPIFLPVYDCKTEKHEKVD